MTICADFEAFLDSLPDQIPDIRERPLPFVLGCLPVLGYPNGLVLEFGVSEGGTIRQIAKYFPLVYGFDSFYGLPEEWVRGDAGFEQGHFSSQGKLPLVPNNVKLIKGLFADTLPEFLKEHPEKVAFVHIDSDLYSSAKQVLSLLSSRMQNGTILVFDELVNYPGYEQHEVKALYEFLQETGYTATWLGMYGPMHRVCTRDDGYQYQSVAVRIGNVP